METTLSKCSKTQFENTIYSQVIIIDPDMVISLSTASAMYCMVQVQD